MALETYAQSIVYSFMNVTLCFLCFFLVWLISSARRNIIKIFCLTFSNLTCLKGIVHPKMKILSSFTHPQVVPNLYEFLCSAEHKGKYSEECGKQSRSGTPLTSTVLFFLLWKSMVPQNSLVTNFLQNIFLCVRQNKKFIQVWNYLRVSKW